MSIPANEDHTGAFCTKVCPPGCNAVPSGPRDDRAREVRLSPDGDLVAIRRGPNDWRVSNGGHYRDQHVADWTPMVAEARAVARAQQELRERAAVIAAAANEEPEDIQAALDSEAARILARADALGDPS